MNYKMSARIRLVCLFITIILCGTAFVTGNSWITAAAVIIYVIGAIQFSIFHRCPRCGVGFRYERRGGYCPHCGEKLD